LCNGIGDSFGNLLREKVKQLWIEVRQWAGKRIIQLGGRVVSGTVVSMSGADDQPLRLEAEVLIDQLQNLRAQSGGQGKQFARNHRESLISAVLKIDGAGVQSRPVAPRNTARRTVSAHRNTRRRRDVRFAGAGYKTSDRQGRPQRIRRDPNLVSAAGQQQDKDAESGGL